VVGTRTLVLQVGVREYALESVRSSRVGPTWLRKLYGKGMGIIRDGDPGPTQGIDEALERRLIERVGTRRQAPLAKK
jgi:hypothetical protein